MQQAVAARQDVDERPELGDVHDATHIDGTHISLWRIDDAEDAGLGLFHAEAIDRTNGDNAHHTVVVDVDVGAGLLLNRVDDLALGPDDLTDLVERNSDRNDLRRCFGNVGARLANAGVHVLKDGIAGLFGLRQRCDQHIGGDAVDLRIELQCGNDVAGTGHFEVHVAKGIFGTEDVGQRGVLAFGIHKAHCDAGHRCLDRDTGLHQREASRADRSHARGTVRGQHFGNKSQRVAEFVLAWQHRDERAGGERTVANLATLGCAHATGFTVGPRGHVVVEQEVLVCLGIEGVEQLVHARHRERCHVHDLRFAALEQTRTVRRWQHADFGRQRTKIAGPATIDTHSLLDNALAHELLGEAANRFLDFLFTTGECCALAAQGGNRSCSCGIGCRIAVSLGADRDGMRQRVGGDASNSVEHLGGVIELSNELQRSDRTLGGNDARDELALETDGLLDPHLAGLEPTSENGFIHLGGAVGVVGKALRRATRFDHHDRNVAVVELTTGDHEFERGGFALGIGGVRNPLAVLAVRDSHRADGAVEWDTADHERCRSSVDREDVVRVFLVGTENGEHDLRLVAEAVWEAGAQRTVGEPTRENRRLCGPTLTTEERTGNLSGCVCTLFDIDSEWEEVHSGTDIFCRVRSSEHDGTANTGQHRALTLLGKFAGLEGHGLVGT